MTHESQLPRHQLYHLASSCCCNFIMNKLLASFLLTIASKQLQIGNLHTLRSQPVELSSSIDLMQQQPCQLAHPCSCETCTPSVPVSCFVAAIKDQLPPGVHLHLQIAAWSTPLIEQRQDSGIDLSLGQYLFYEAVRRFRPIWKFCTSA